MDGDVEAAGAGRDEEVRDPAALRRREEDALARRPHREDPVEPPVGQELRQRRERVLVERPSRLARSGVTAAARAPSITRRTLCCAAMSALRIERDGDVLRVTIAKPERRNAFDAALIAELTEAFADVGDARAVVLAGDGPSFCAGADVEWQRSSVDLSYDENVADALRLYRMLEAIDACPRPWWPGSRASPSAAARASSPAPTSRWPAPDAVFGFTEVRLGIIPAVISPFVLDRIGPARRAVLPDRRAVRRRAALRIGLVHEIADDLDGAVERVVGNLLAAGPEAVRAAKRLDPRAPARRGDRPHRGALRTSPRARRACGRSWRSARRPSRAAPWGVYSRRTPMSHWAVAPPLPPALAPQVRKTTSAIRATTSRRPRSGARGRSA